MKIRYDRIARAQVLMKEQGIAGIVVMNHDDFRYFLGTDRAQPRAIIPASGAPTLIAFAGEEPELRALIGEGDVSIFTSVGQQIHDVVRRLREVVVGQGGDPEARPRIGMQMWFETPAFLVDLFRQLNPKVELVSSDPVMDRLRMVKDPDEIALMTEAQRIAAVGMDRAREMLRPGVTGHQVATEVLYTMMKAGAEKTATPIHVNLGIESCMLHGRQSPRAARKGDLAVIDLTPQVEGYCANLARTFVLGEPDERQRLLLDTAAELIEPVRQTMRPGATVRDLDERVAEVCERRGLGEYRVEGIGHGLGLRFEETPAPTIIPPHRTVQLLEGMTMTIGHPILAIPGFGGARFEDVYRVTPEGGQLLHPYPIDPVITC
jgi:Xaa-Pro dipeptidase